MWLLLWFICVIGMIKLLPILGTFSGKAVKLMVFDLLSLHDALPICGAARLDRAGGAVADLEEAHQAGGLAAAGEALAGGGKDRKSTRLKSSHSSMSYAVLCL